MKPVPHKHVEQDRTDRGRAIEYRITKVEGLTSSEWAAWAAIQEAEPSLASPYFRPEFAEVVAAVRDDVRVVVLARSGSAVGFFPFQRSCLGFGRPLGGPVSDYHGVIAPPGLNWSVRELLRAAGLSVWSFDHLLAWQEPFHPYHAREHQSPIMDLSRGFETYARRRRDAGSRQIPKVDALARKLTRDVGPLRFEAQVEDHYALGRVIAWKSAQCRRTGGGDVFGSRWTVHLLERLLATCEPAFAGMLSVLYVGDELAAAHMGMRSASVWHYWFPSYNDRFAKFSPGLILLLRMAQAANGLGIQTIDLGKDITLYKKRLMSSTVPIAEGCVETPSVAAGMCRIRRSLESLAQRRSWGLPAKAVLRIVHRIERNRRFR